MSGLGARASDRLRSSVGVFVALLMLLVPFLHEHQGGSSTTGWHWHLNIGQALPVGADPVDQNLVAQGPLDDGMAIGIDALLERPAHSIPDNPLPLVLNGYLLALTLVLSVKPVLTVVCWLPRHIALRERPGLPPQSLAPPRN